VPLFRRDPTKKLEKAYQQKMEEAMHAIRRGDVRELAEADPRARLDRRLGRLLAA